MRFSSDSVKKILACDQVTAGLEFNKRPGNQELIFGHILLCHDESRMVVPRDITDTIGCSPESLRLLLRRAEKRDYLFCGGRPNYEIKPAPKLLWMVHKVSQEWLVNSQRRLLPFRPTVREVYTVAQAFDIHSRVKNSHGFMFKSPIKRGIVYFVLDRMCYGHIELKQIKRNFPIDHESLRQFINAMVDAGYLEKIRQGNQTCIRATQTLREVANDAADIVCAGLSGAAESFTPYTDFLAWLGKGVDEPRKTYLMAE